MYSAAGDVWPYGGVGGVLHCCHGLLGLSVQQAHHSIHIGSDLDAFTSTLDQITDSKEVASAEHKMCTMVLKKGQSAFLFFGVLPLTCSLPFSRPKLTTDESAAASRFCSRDFWEAGGRGVMEALESGQFEDFTVTKAITGMLTEVKEWG